MASIMQGATDTRHAVARTHYNAHDSNSSDRELAALIFSICVIGIPAGCVLGLTAFLTWFQ